MFSSNTSQVSDDKLFVEDCFSCFLYQGNGSTQTITNGIDLAGKGGLVWMKGRNNTTDRSHNLVDTARGSNKSLFTNLTNGDATATDRITSFNSNGFGLGSSFVTNENTFNYASWTFRKAPKFFDVVTYTGNGANRNIAHNLGVAPGCIIVKRTDTTSDWQVYHRGYDGGANASWYFFTLNSNIAVTQNSGRWNNTQPTSTEFTVGTNTNVNASGGTYVAYLFGHDTTSDGIIQCGSYTGNGSATGPTISLGWEPQWVMIKSADPTTNWLVFDNMRGMPVGSADAILQANLSNAETSVDYISPTATGFQVVSTNANVNTNTSTYIYIAIRRGPMRTPTSGTSVFAPVAFTSATPYGATTNFPLDMIISSFRNITTGHDTLTRLTGDRNYLQTPFSSQESVGGAQLINFANNTGYTNSLNYSGTYNTIDYAFRRAPSFMDVVCYTGGGATTSVYNHNLGVVPELIIIKSRSNGTNVNWWPVKIKSVLGQKALALNSTNPDPLSNATYWASADDTATQFRTRASATAYDVNATGYTYVAYLFASCPGVSKVGSYTGNGSSQTINCGFAAGARFVMIKRTDSTGDWYVWDTARGIVAGNDPHLSLNTTAAEVTTDDSVDTDSSGFVVNQDAATNINVSSATYIYLAVA